MKRIITTIAVAIATICTANAQELKFGAKAGLNFSTLSSPEVSQTQNGYTTTTKMDLGFRTGFHIGAFVEYGFTDRLFVEGGIAYSSQGAKFNSVETKTVNRWGDVIDSQKIDAKDASVILNQVNLPIWVKYDIAGFRPKAGLNLGYLADVKAKENGKTESQDPEKRFDFGLGIGAEYNLPMGLFFDANFTLGLTNLAAKQSKADIKNRVIQIGVGYKF